MKFKTNPNNLLSENKTTAMKNKYRDLIEQSFEFPNEEFNVIENDLEWFGVPLMDIIKQYGTPLRIAYLPKIGQNIQKARLS